MVMMRTIGAVSSFNLNRGGYWTRPEPIIGPAKPKKSDEIRNLCAC
jgi:hypothetical protein